MKRVCWILILIYAAGLTAAELPFHRGVNLTGWFQTAGPRSIQFTEFTRSDFEQIRSLGCDVIRLPINLHAMTSGAPDYTLDPLFIFSGRGRDLGGIARFALDPGQPHLRSGRKHPGRR